MASFESFGIREHALVQTAGNDKGLSLDVVQDDVAVALVVPKPQADPTMSRYEQVAMESYFYS